MTRSRCLREDRSPDRAGRDFLERITAEIKKDGSVKISGVFMGAVVEDVFRHFDHEFGLTIPADKVAEALVEVLEILFATKPPYNFSDLAAQLKGAGIAEDSWVW